MEGSALGGCILFIEDNEFYCDVFIHVSCFGLSHLLPASCHPSCCSLTSLVKQFLSWLSCHGYPIALSWSLLTAPLGLFLPSPLSTFMSNFVSVYTCLYACAHVYECARACMHVHINLNLESTYSRKHVAGQ